MELRAKSLSLDKSKYLRKIIKDDLESASNPEIRKKIEGNYISDSPEYHAAIYKKADLIAQESARVRRVYSLKVFKLDKDLIDRQADNIIKDHSDLNLYNKKESVISDLTAMAKYLTTGDLDWLLANYLKKG